MAGAIAAILEEGRVVRQDERDELTDPCVLLIFYLPQVDCQNSSFLKASHTRVASPASWLESEASGQPRFLNAPVLHL